MGNKSKTSTGTKPRQLDYSGKEDLRFLVLHNDDHHTFDYVIKCLIEVCGHTTIQAEQCTYLVHFKGNCDILHGELKKLMPYYKEMIKKELIVTIE